MRIAVIDDDPSVRSFLGDALRTLGYDAELYPCGADALAELQEPPALVVLDISIPGEDVHRTLVALRERFPGSPVLVSSGRELADRALELEAAGAAAFLEKPYRFRTLRAVLAELIAA